MSCGFGVSFPKPKVPAFKVPRAPSLPDVGASLPGPEFSVDGVSLPTPPIPIPRVPRPKLPKAPTLPEVSASLDADLGIDVNVPFPKPRVPMPKIPKPPKLPEVLAPHCPFDEEVT